MVNLGDTVKDVITGYIGIAVSSHHYLHGCTRFVVQSRELKDGKPIEDQYFDEQRLVVDQSIPNILEEVPLTNNPGGDRPIVRQPRPLKY